MSLTPYAAHLIVNAALKAAGTDKVIPPQMMYNYTTGRLNKGKSPLIECDSDNRVTEAGLETWLAKYLVKQGVKLTTPVEEYSV